MHAQINGLAISKDMSLFFQGNGSGELEVRSAAGAAARQPAEAGQRALSGRAAAAAVPPAANLPPWSGLATGARLV